MTLLVVDASVVVKWFLPEIFADAALRLRDSAPCFMAPDHVFAETVVGGDQAGVALLCSPHPITRDY
jgi:predicted nucleic acid-binding protein